MEQNRALTGVFSEVSQTGWLGLNANAALWPEDSGEDNAALRSGPAGRRGLHTMDRISRSYFFSAGGAPPPVLGKPMKILKES